MTAKRERRLARNRAVRGGMTPAIRTAALAIAILIAGLVIAQVWTP